MRIPIPERCINAAKEYAKNSFGYTYNHPGWEKEQSKQNRILFGKIAELTVIDFLKINEVGLIEDTSDFTQNDDFDFVFELRRYDVKTTYTSSSYCCITRTYENKEIDFFIATKIDFELRYIEVFGVVRKSDAINATYFKKHTEQLPESNYTCQFLEGAYFYTGSYEDMLSHFKIQDIDKVSDYWRQLALSKINVA